MFPSRWFARSESKNLEENSNINQALKQFHGNEFDRKVEMICYWTLKEIYPKSINGEVDFLQKQQQSWRREKCVFDDDEKKFMKTNFVLFSLNLRGSEKVKNNKKWMRIDVPIWHCINGSGGLCTA